MPSRIDFKREQIQKALIDGVETGLIKVSLSLQRRIKKKLDKPGSGRVYKYGKDNKGRHQASAPGEPPATRSGNLANSWTTARRRGPVRYNKGIEIALRPAKVGGAAKYAWWLEYGTKRMKPRPYIRPSVEQMNRNKRASKIVESQLVRHIAQANRTAD
tara:strand:+ start:520 stop:996 length:477 start_codon:yes stop_codon:yes gene_type:complete